MNRDPELETLLRSLRPATLPDPLQTAMKDPPARIAPASPRYLRWLALPLAAAAVWLLLATLRHEPVSAPASPAPITLRQSQSTLLDSRPLELVRIDDQYWELAEQEWLDEDLTLCSASPVTVKLTTTRREIVWQPVRFD